MSAPQTVAVLMEDELLTLNRAVGVLRRRNLPVRGIAVGPTGTPGLSRLTVMISTDPATADRVVKQFQKTAGVREAVLFSAEDGIARELALVKVRTPQERRAELLDTIALYKGTLVDEGPEAVIAEIAGPGSFVLSFLRAVERFDIVEVARSGPVALERAGASSPQSDGD